MQVSLDGASLAVGQAATLAELLDGLAPLIDPARIVTGVDVDGVPADATDDGSLAGWRLRGTETVRIETQTPREFAASRRNEVDEHLKRIAVLLSDAAAGLVAGETTQSNRRLAAATRDLGLVLALDRHLSLLDEVGARCEQVAAVVNQIGSRLTDAERGQRWNEVAQILESELVPALRAAVS